MQVILKPDLRRRQDARLRDTLFLYLLPHLPRFFNRAFILNLRHVALEPSLETSDQRLPFPKVVCLAAEDMLHLASPLPLTLPHVLSPYAHGEQVRSRAFRFSVHVAYCVGQLSSRLWEKSLCCKPTGESHHAWLLLEI